MNSISNDILCKIISLLDIVERNATVCKRWNNLMVCKITTTAEHSKIFTVMIRAKVYLYLDIYESQLWIYCHCSGSTRNTHIVCHPMYAQYVKGISAKLTYLPFYAIQIPLYSWITITIYIKYDVAKYILISRDGCAYRAYKSVKYNSLLNFILAVINHEYINVSLNDSINDVPALLMDILYLYQKNNATNSSYLLSDDIVKYVANY